MLLNKLKLQIEHFFTVWENLTHIVDALVSTMRENLTCIVDTLTMRVRYSRIVEGIHEPGSGNSLMVILLVSFRLLYGNGPMISLGNLGTGKFLYEWRSHEYRNLKFSMNHERYIANPP